MEVMAELNTEFFDDSAPAVGPGGLVNLSRVSRDLSKGQSTKDEALRALPPPPPPPQKKRSDLYGPGVGARGPGSARDADDDLSTIGSFDPAWPRRAAAAPRDDQEQRRRDYVAAAAPRDYLAERRALVDAHYDPIGSSKRGRRAAKYERRARPPA